MMIRMAMIKVFSSFFLTTMIVIVIMIMILWLIVREGGDDILMRFTVLRMTKLVEMRILMRIVYRKEHWISLFCLFDGNYDNDDDNDDEGIILTTRLTFWQASSTGLCSPTSPTASRALSMF